MLKPCLTLLPCILLLILSSCEKPQEIVEEVYLPKNDHEAYLYSLEQANLQSTALGRDWIAAAEDAKTNPLEIEAPFAEDFYVRNDAAFSSGYVFSANRGHQIQISIEKEVRDSAKVFLDVFRIENDSLGRYTHIASTQDDYLYIEFEPLRDARYIVRFQSELLRSGRYRIEIQKVPALAFPVMGKDKRAIGSLFGAPRDGGRRKHHGVDIFARRHTPIIAPTEGRIRFAGTKGLGGKVVWMRDTERDQTLYFAHLHDILVEEGDFVYPGDTLGTVGNTGNARTTPPHLHFGIYQNGPLDPYHFVANTRTRFKNELAKVEMIGQKGRAKSRINLKLSGPIRKSKIRKLEKSQIFDIVGTTAAYYKVRLPDNTIGYLEYTNIETLKRPVKRTRLLETIAVFTSPQKEAIPIAEIRSGERVEILGSNGSFDLVSHQDGSMGWAQLGD